MKKFTAKVAKKLSIKQQATRPKTFQEAINFLVTEANL